MPNERLRAAISEAGFNPQSLSEHLDVDPKTVERWISRGRVPHRRHRMNTVTLVGKSEGFLWPATETDTRTRSATHAEFVDFYPNRGAIPTTLWTALLSDAAEAVDLHAFAASFLHDSVPGFAETLEDRARAGVRVRLLFGDPASEAVALRGQEEGIGSLMASRCELTWSYLQPILQTPGVEGRQHASTLYASLFRFDDTLLVNTHAYGVAAGHSPVLHFTRIPGGRLFSQYLESFDRVWNHSDTRPVPPVGG